MSFTTTFSRLSRLLNGGKQPLELQRAIAAAQSIDKAHQFIKLGHVYQDLGERAHALAAYHQAIKKEPENLEALWGAATIELAHNNWKQASFLLQKLVGTNAEYKFGDASLAYCRVLFHLGDFNLAEYQLENHLKQWSHPDALLMMAEIKAHQENTLGACHLLETMISNVEGAPAFHHRKHQRQMKKGQRILKTLSC